MFIVKLVNINNNKDIVVYREYENQIDAEKYYDSVKSAALDNKNTVVRPYNEELQQEELKYIDVVLYLLENERRISKFMIG